MYTTAYCSGGLLCGEGGGNLAGAAERAIAANPRIPGPDRGAHPFGRHVGAGKGAVRKEMTHHTRSII